MFAIPGLDPLGFLHALFGLAALGCGLAVVANRKGTRRHRRLGYAYVTSMLLLNGTAFAIYDLYGRFGPFHMAGLVSLATLGGGVIPAVLRRRWWMETHAYFMAWSYVGLVAAFLAEIAVRLPRVGIGRAVFAGLVVAVGVGAILIHTRVPRILARLGAEER